MTTKLYGGTGLDFLYGNGGEDQLFRANGSPFESLDDGLAGEEWKTYARSTNRVWYIGASNADDEIFVDYVTEPGTLQGRHLVSRKTMVGDYVTFDAKIRLDFSAIDEDGNPVWDPSDVLLDLEPLLTDNLRDRQDALAEVGLHEQQLVGGLLPPEGDFMAIIIDALAGDDYVRIGPTVQKTVWIDAGSGDDRVEIQAGNPILIDQTEYGARNDTPASAFLLGGRAAIKGIQPVPSDGRLTANAIFDLRVGNGTPVTVTLAASATMDNTAPEDLLADLNQALQDAGIYDEVVAGLKGGEVILMTTQVGAQASLSLTPLSGSAGAAQLGFGADQSATGEDAGQQRDLPRPHPRQPGRRGLLPFPARGGG